MQRCSGDSIPYLGIQSLNYGDSIPYLGMHLIHTSNLEELIKFNINKRMFNVAKYKSWLEVKKNTPFSVKLQVLDNCVLSAILYGSEVRGNLLFIKNKLNSIELDLLKSALRVKQGTPNDLVYHELNRSEISSKLQVRQKRFIHRIEDLDADDAVVKCVWVKSQALDFSKYYVNLLQNKDNNSEHNRNLRVHKLKVSEKSMDKRYRDLIGLEEQHCIYDSFVDDECRAIVSRWRLSNHKLAIETGRYKNIPRIDRHFQICSIVEDEIHVMFHCPLYCDLRSNHADLLSSKNSVKMFLNPKNKNELYDTANMLKEIETLHAMTFK